MRARVPMGEGQETLRVSPIGRKEGALNGVWFRTQRFYVIFGHCARSWTPCRGDDPAENIPEGTKYQRIRASL